MLGDLGKLIVAKGFNKSKKSPDLVTLVGSDWMWHTKLFHSWFQPHSDTHTHSLSHSFTHIPEFLICNVTLFSLGLMQYPRWGKNVPKKRHIDAYNLTVLFLSDILCLPQSKSPKNFFWGDLNGCSFLFFVPQKTFTYCITNCYKSNRYSTTYR